MSALDTDVAENARTDARALIASMTLIETLAVVMAIWRAQLMPASSTKAGTGCAMVNGMTRLAVLVVTVIVAALPQRALPRPAQPAAQSVLDTHLLVTWYGNPRSTRMGILGERDAAARAEGLRAQAAAYAGLTSKTVIPAYELVTVVAQCTAGRDEKWRRREGDDFIRGLLAEARANGFKLVLDVQPGRSNVADEVNALRPYLAEPDVYLALDPEFAMSDCEVPGREIGQMSAADINDALAILESEIAKGSLPPKVLIVHQFRVDMLPDKKGIRDSPTVDVVLNMDGFGSQSLKHASYRTIMRHGPLEFAGIKLFYRQDTNLFSPAQVMSMTPKPSVVIYQ